MNIYRYLDYRVVIGKLIEERRKSNRSFRQEHLATATRVQKTYMSKVINGTVHLNSDQLFEVIEYFNLDQEASDYLYLLLEFGRSSSAKRKKILQEKIAAIQLENRSVKKGIQRPIIKSDLSAAELDYFLEPLALVVHQFLLLKGKPLSENSIAQKLGLSRERFNEVIKILEQSGAVTFGPKKENWIATPVNFHLPKESRIGSARLKLIRDLASQYIARVPVKQRFSYTSTIRADENTKNFIHEQILKLLREIEPVIAAAPEANVYELSFDLFPWGAE